jgi:hypothetical protein
MKYQVDEKGFYGDFGGAYIPSYSFKVWFETAMMAVHV